MLSGLMFFFCSYRLIRGHNIDKIDICTQRNKNFQEYMLHFVYKLSFSIRRGTSPLFITAPPPALDLMRFIAGFCGQHNYEKAIQCFVTLYAIQLYWNNRIKVYFSFSFPVHEK